MNIKMMHILAGSEYLCLLLNHDFGVTPFPEKIKTHGLRTAAFPNKEHCRKYKSY